MTGMELYLALIGELETALGCPVSKGFPAWARNQVTVEQLPLGALQIARLGMVGPQRIGAGPARPSLAWSAWVFAQDEVQLVDLWADRLTTWLKQTPVIVVNSVRVSLALESADRHDNQNNVQQEEHGIALTLITQW